MASVVRKAADHADLAGSERLIGAVPEGRIALKLRDERRKQGLSLDDVAEALKIRKNYVEAIENERYAELPGPTYGLGFVGSYAQLLDLDRRAVIARFRDEVAGVYTETELKFLLPLKDGRIPGRAILAASVVLAIAVYGGWYAYSNRGAIAPVASTPAPVSKAVEKQTVAATKAEGEALRRYLRAVPVSKEAGNTEEVAVASQPIPKKAARKLTRRERAAARRAKARKAKAEKLAAAGAPASGKARIVLKATQDTWVQIQLADGTLVISRILKAGETYAVLKNRGLVLTAGNAGGLRIIVDGRTLPALGPKGAVRQGIRLDANKLLASR